MTKRTLPVLAPLRPFTLAWFDATTTSRIARRVLRDELGPERAGSVVRSVLRRALTADPTRSLPRPRDRDERLTRMQLRSVLLLDDAVRHDLGLPAERAREVVRAVVRASGTAFLLRFFAGFPAENWVEASDDERASFASGLASRIFNAETADLRTDAESLAFDVVRCRFVADLETLGRTDLAPLFCEVDAALVEREDVPFALDRPSTLAAGGERCRFRFHRR